MSAYVIVNLKEGVEDSLAERARAFEAGDEGLELIAIVDRLSIARWHPA
jgi:hypothetical protein